MSEELLFIGWICVGLLSILGLGWIFVKCRQINKEFTDHMDDWHKRSLDE